MGCSSGSQWDPGPARLRELGRRPFCAVPFAGASADGDRVNVKTVAKFIGNQAKATQVSQYELRLHKDNNWKITG